jgi:hypothetical protein
MRASLPPPDAALTPDVADDLARRALANIAREYPNHPQLLLDSATDLLAPRTAHPIFFGCFDWHSAVHNHWLLLRLARQVPALAARDRIDAAFAAALSADNVRVEADYLERRPSFERPYGLAWLMLLTAEARRTGWAAPLGPLATVGRANVVRWLEALRHPVRSGAHAQTAFALTLLHDAAAALRDEQLSRLVASKTHELYRGDAGATLRFEPSGEDFLSPTLMEADLMRRVLSSLEFADWLSRFLPELPRSAAEPWLDCATVADETDGKAVHLHGLNLSRAWNLAKIAAALPAGDARAAPLRAAAARHRDAGLRATLATRHYAGDHWLPSFAVYLLTSG